MVPSHGCRWKWHFPSSLSSSTSINVGDASPTSNFSFGFKPWSVDGTEGTEGTEEASENGVHRFLQEMVKSKKWD